MRRSIPILSALIWSAGAAAGPTVQPFVESEVQSGCGCNFQFVGPAATGKTFLWWLEGEDAFMRVDGRLEKLSVEQTGGRSKKRGVISVGDATSYVLRNKSLQVKVSTTVVQACSPENVECESVGVKASAVATSPSGTTTVKGLGTCGC